MAWGADTRWSTKQTVPPTGEPIALSDCYNQCRINDNYSDAILTIYLQAAREKVEAEARRQLMPATWVWSTDHFPFQWYVERQADLFNQRRDGRGTYALQQAIELPFPPLVGVTSIQYVDIDQQLQTIDPAAYQVDTFNEPGRVLPSYGLCWPISLLEANSVQITYVAGYASAALVPAHYKLAILLLVEHWNKNRSLCGDQGAMALVPEGYQNLFFDRDIRFQ